jgi:FemAB-related protein (PEP-CTERM system-associated)
VPRIELASAEDAAAWDTYVERQPGATVHNLFCWKVVAEQAYGLRAPFLLARDRPKGAIRGVLPLIRIPRPFAGYFTTGLFGAYGPLLVDDEPYARGLLAAAAKRVDNGEARHLHLRFTGSVPAGLGLDRRDVWVTAKLDLGTDEDALWESLPRKLRWSVRRATKAGIRAACGLDDFDAFYDVLFENMHRKGAPIYGRSFFRWVMRTLGSRVDLVTLRDRGRVVSGAFVVSFQGTLYVPFSSSRADYFRQRVSHLLFWEIMRRARERGCHTLDFGSSLRDSKGLDFKTAWRPRIEAIGSYVYAPSGGRLELDPRAMSVATAAIPVLARIPRGLAHVVGPPLCRWIA